MIDRAVLDYVFNKIRPQLQADGGDAEITDVDQEKGIVYVALQGACVGCPMSAITLNQGIEAILVENVPGVEKVLPDMDRTDAFASMREEVLDPAERARLAEQKANGVYAYSGSGADSE